MNLDHRTDTMGFLKRKKQKRVCVIGLDGVPEGMIRDLSKSGVMPHFAELLAEGRLHRMKASLPEISSVSWTNFMTGKDPGTHGIFGFTDLKPGSYDLRFPNFRDVRTGTFWDELARRKRTSIVINQPSTYPARRINGVLISGFVAIEMAKAVSPPTFLDPLHKLGYAIDIDTLKARSDHQFLWKDLARTLKGRERAWEMLWSEEWDFFELVITGTDRLQHFLWDAYADVSHPHHQAFLDYYHRVDTLIRRIREAYEDRTGSLDGFALLSDHGFTGIRQEVTLNVWLKQNGYLRTASPRPQSLNDLDPATVAFAMDPNRIYLHTSNRFPKGSVPAGRRAELKEELAERLRGLKFEGEPVVQDVFDTERIYSGPLVAQGPDLIVLGRPGFDMKGSIKKEDLFGRTDLQGMHTYDDAFFWAPRDHGADLRISDLAEILLGHFE
jgi:predicted AlkP superfamily phosphohydrolase/phosphomutase